ncbi:hypothetical protein [uncultured Dysosmobacter sp.]|uniref:hypothetical protein n=1 Tax=uncultured Dysosmobacter sp. TaxID=2591384 RepID=UPI002612583C|nr:hypothetical protein [uncultured Dysosmobacter sp.]
MPRKSQRKGRSGELELARRLQAHGLDVRPGEPVSYGREPDLVGLDGIHCEVKRAEQQKIWDWLGQAKRDSNKFHDGIPVVFWRKNLRPWIVCMDLNDWLRLYEKWKKPEKKREEVKSDP